MSEVETVEDIEREMRNGVASLADDIPFTVAAGTIRNIADRIKAAVKRECEHCWKSNMRGNSAAMREALREVQSTLGRWHDCNAPRNPQIVHLWEVVSRALAAPARSCDMYADESEARNAFIDWYNTVYGLKGDKYEVDSCDLKHNIDDILKDYIEWLLAPAAERKGDDDGR